jgi:hypothetical protein
MKRFILFTILALSSLVSMAQRVSFSPGFLVFTRFPANPATRDSTFERYPADQVSLTYKKVSRDILITQNTGTVEKTIYKGNQKDLFYNAIKNPPIDCMYINLQRAANPVDCMLVVNTARFVDTPTVNQKFAIASGKPFTIQCHVSQTSASTVLYTIHEFSGASSDSNVVTSFIVPAGSTAVGAFFATTPIMLRGDSVKITRSYIGAASSVYHTLTIQTDVPATKYTGTIFESFTLPWFTQNALSRIYDISRFRKISLLGRSSAAVDFVMQGSVDRISWVDIGGTRSITNTDAPISFLTDTATYYNYVRFKTVSATQAETPGAFKYIALIGSE